MNRPKRAAAIAINPWRVNNACPLRMACDGITLRPPYRLLETASMNHRKSILTVTLLLASLVRIDGPAAQTVEKLRLGYSGTGINNYVLEMGKRQGIFGKNGLDLEVVYVNSGSLLSQALIAGTFDLSFSQGSEAMIAKLRGADVRIAAVVANRFNHVYLAAPSITSIKQLKGKKVAVSRFGSGSHFQTNLALKEGGLDPEKDVTVLQSATRARASRRF
jgi:NitT/TauT family transport system substrate-binding protein